MKCPQCRKEMERVNKQDRKVIRWRCHNPNCPQILPIRVPANDK